MSDLYEGGIRLDESTGIDLRADADGDSWVTVWIAGEVGSSSMQISPSADELRELAVGLKLCADAADEARQSYSANSNGNGAHG